MKKKITGLLSLFLLTGCISQTSSGPVDVIPLRSPADPEHGIRHQSQGNIIGEFIRRKPTDPGEWRKLNNEQTNPLGGGS